MRVRCEERNCKHYIGIHRELGIPICTAYTYGIPKEILDGTEDHTHLNRHQTRAVAFGAPRREVVKPISDEEMERYAGYDNICSTLRNIYHMTDNEEMRFWLRVARRMAQNMMMALTDYKQMLVENNIATVHMHGVQRDSVEYWQHRPKCLYRGKNKPLSEGLYE